MLNPHFCTCFCLYPVFLDNLEGIGQLPSNLFQTAGTINLQPTTAQGMMIALIGNDVDQKRDQQKPLIWSLLSKAMAMTFWKVRSQEIWATLSNCGDWSIPMVQSEWSKKTSSCHLLWYESKNHWTRAFGLILLRSLESILIPSQKRDFHIPLW